MSLFKLIGKKFAWINITLILLSTIGGIYLNPQGFLVNIFAGVAGVFVSFLVGITILNRYTAAQRDRQWKKVRNLTLMSLTNHLYDIAQEAGIYCNIGFQPGENSSPFEDGRDYPNFAVAEAILALCLKMQRLPGADDPADNKLSDIAVEFYQEIRWSLDQVSNVLLPRIVQSTNEQEVIDSIAEFDRARLKLHNAAFVHKRIVIGGIFPDMINLVKCAHNLYSIGVRTFSKSGD